MIKKTYIPNGITNPFSDKFAETWQMWKDYKSQTFGFEYKGIFSEQMTLKKLCELSDGDEDRAVRIIEQSIMRQWQGLFPLHIPSANGKSTKKQPISKSQSTPPSNTSFNEAYHKRYGNGGQTGSEPHLKAV
jgi:hypothetical protein